MKRKNKTPKTPVEPEARLDFVAIDCEPYISLASLCDYLSLVETAFPGNRTALRAARGALLETYVRSCAQDEAQA